MRSTLHPIILAAGLLAAIPLTAPAAPIQFNTPFAPNNTVTQGPGSGAGTGAGAGANSTSQVEGLEGAMDTLWRRDNLTGNWGGFRDTLYNRGISITPVWQTEYFGNTGGFDQGHIFDGVFNVALDLDLESITGFWHDAVIHTNALYIYGQSLSSRYVGDFSNTSNLAGYNSVKLQELWLQQSFWRKRASLRVGLLAADTEFFGSQASSLFINGTFGAFTLFGANFANAPVYPVASPGIRLDVQPTSKFDFKAAIFSANSTADPASNNSHGTYFNIDTSQDGVLGAAEASFFVNQSPGDRGLMGTYRLGGFVQNGDYTTFFSQARFALGTGELSRHGTNYAVYAVGDQELYKHGGRIVSAFARGGFASPRYSFVSGYFDLGLNFTGFVPNRPVDVAGLAIADSIVSSDFSKASVAQGTGSFQSEIALEATYRVVLAPWWTVQPDIQYIVRPSAQRGAPDAFVFGVRSTVTF